MIPRAKLLLDRGFSVLLIDLQGQGETPGASITFGLRESADVQAALKWIRRAARDRSVGVIGCSLGGAAVLLGPQPAGFDAVVLEAVYPRITDAVENRIRIRFGPLAPVLAPLLLAQLRLRSHIAPGDLEPIRSIATLGAPLLVVAGSRDQHTTIAESEALFGAAVQPKQIWVVNDARHQDFLAFDPAGYDATVVGFLREHLRLPMNETKLRDFARHYTAAWCSQDPARVASFFAETGCLKINEGSPSVGRTAVTAAAQSFMSAFPDMVVKMDGLSIEGGGVVYRWTLTGTNTGPGGTGRAVRISGYEEWTIGADGLIASSKGLFDDAGYQRQLKGE